ncbi:MAG TPA: IclR family transcriptional regulator [Bauldia sp.]|nr:IclR family transcriptional regulator [Bauldia sp.]
MAPSDAESRYRAPALDKGLDIIELLAATDESMSQAEIAKALGRSPNEIYRMLDRLVHRNYVVNVHGGRYELALKLFALAHQHVPMRRLVSQATAVMRQFARTAEQSAHLAVYDRGAVLVVAQADSPSYWGLAIRVGARVGLINRGSGHVLLAFATPRERAFMLEEREPIPGEELPADLEARLETVRRNGYEMMESFQSQGVINISVPVLGPNGTAIAALTCPFIHRIDPGGALDVATVAGLLQDAGRELSRMSGGIEEDATD